MDARQYTTVDKGEWPRGAWDDEPDKLQWRDEVTGLPCLIVRADLGGNLCGYVGVPASHPWHGKQYGDACITYVEVHGGLTFADACQGEDEARGICHVPAPGEPDHVWWFGFDCAHAWDVMPAMVPRLSFGGDCVYRDLPYVRGEVTQLAAQLAAVRA